MQKGRLALDAPWLRKELTFLPLGLYVRGVRMHLPMPPVDTNEGWLAVAEDE